MSRIWKSANSILIYLLRSGKAVTCGGGADPRSIAGTDDSAVVVRTQRQIKDDLRPACADGLTGYLRSGELTK